MIAAGEAGVLPVVALDVPNAAAARGLVEQLGPACDFYKVGLELYSAEGPAMVRWLRESGKRVFVDLKLHDIPNTVRSAARAVARSGASLLTVHAGGGTAMIAAAVQGAAEGSPEGRTEGSPEGADGCEILAVTILTSLNGREVGEAWGRPPVEVTDEVVRLAGLAREGGAAGVVCSGRELPALRAVHGNGLGYLVPGLRLAGSAADDQRRVVTPGAAAVGGARWLILGRTVTAAPDPVAAMAAVRDDIALAFASQAE